MESSPFNVPPVSLWCRWLLVVAVLIWPAVQTAQQSPSSSAPEPATQTAGQKLSGLSVIVRVDSIEGDPLFYADGYRIRISTPGTAVKLPTELKTLADVKPNTWIRYEGVRDKTGVLVARTAEFYPTGTQKAFTSIGPKKAKRALDYQRVTQDSLLDADGHFVSPRTKVRYSDAGGPCGWHKVPADMALQDRVERVGMSVVPEFQKKLAQDAASRIPFRFYAVADDKVRSAFACNDGLILVPRNAVERLLNDDQLAAVLAEAVAFNLQRQLSTVTPLDRIPGATDVAMTAIAVWSPAVYIAGDLAEGVVGYELQAKVHRQCARIALQLMANAGYDPWQAPEAWRILGPKEPPQDVRSLEYTGQGKFQLNILKVQYQRSSASAADPMSAAQR